MRTRALAQIEAAHKLAPEFARINALIPDNRPTLFTVNSRWVSTGTPMIDSDSQPRECSFPNSRREFCGFWPPQAQFAARTSALQLVRVRVTASKRWRVRSQANLLV